MQDLVGSRQPDVRGVDRYDLNRVAGGSEELNFQRGPFLVDVHDGSYVSGAQPMLGQIPRKHNAIKLFHRGLGYAVTRRSAAPFD